MKVGICRCTPTATRKGTTRPMAGITQKDLADVIDRTTAKQAVLHAHVRPLPRAEEVGDRRRQSRRATYGRDRHALGNPKMIPQPSVSYARLRCGAQLVASASRIFTRDASCMSASRHASARECWPTSGAADQLL
jgi:hypothetical protein